MALTPSVERVLRGAPPVLLVGGQRHAVVVDREAGLVRGLGPVYEALRVGANDALVLTPTAEGLLVEAAPRPARPKARREEAAAPPPREAGPEKPPTPEPHPRRRKVVRLLPGGGEEMVEEGGEGPKPPTSSRLAQALEALGRLGFVPVHREEALAVLVSEAGPLILYAEPPSPPPRSAVYAHLGEGAGPRIAPEALEALGEAPVRPHQLLERLAQGLPLRREDVLAMSRSLEAVLAAKAPLTALLLHLSKRRPGDRIGLEEAEEAAPGASALLPLLQAPPFLLLKRRGAGYELLRSPREALRDLLEYARALLALLGERPAAEAARGGRSGGGIIPLGQAAPLHERKS